MTVQIIDTKMFVGSIVMAALYIIWFFYFLYRGYKYKYSTLYYMIMEILIIFVIFDWGVIALLETNLGRRYENLLFITICFIGVGTNLSAGLLEKYLKLHGDKKEKLRISKILRNWIVTFFVCHIFLFWLFYPALKILWFLYWESF